MKMVHCFDEKYKWQISEKLCTIQFFFSLSPRMAPSFSTLLGIYTLFSILQYLNYKTMEAIIKVVSLSFSLICKTTKQQKLSFYGKKTWMEKNTNDRSVEKPTFSKSADTKKIIYSFLKIKPYRKRQKKYPVI